MYWNHLSRDNAYRFQDICKTWKNQMKDTGSLKYKTILKKTYSREQLSATDLEKKEIILGQPS